jgi:rod shape-determining protein MreC
MVKRLYDILLLFKEYFVVAFFLLTSVVLLAANDTSQIRVIRSYAVVAVGLLQNSLSFIPNYFDLRRDNEALRAMNLSLSDEVSRLREGKLENLRLRQMLELKERAEFRTISASVVGKNLQLLRNTITLDVGEKDGVRINMPVINESGLVGKIIGTSSRYAIGQILLNKDIRVSAKVQRSRVDGIIRWTGGRCYHHVGVQLALPSGDQDRHGQRDAPDPGIPVPERGSQSGRRLLPSGRGVRHDVSCRHEPQRR